MSLQGESGVNPLYRLVVGSYLPGCPAVRFWGHGPCSRTPPLCLCHRRPGGTVPCRPLAARLDAGATQHFGERCASRDLCVLGPRPSRLGPDTRGRRPGGGQLMLWLDAAGQTGQWRSPAPADHLRLLLQRARAGGWSAAGSALKRGREHSVHCDRRPELRPACAGRGSRGRDLRAAGGALRLGAGAGCWGWVLWAGC